MATHPSKIDLQELTTAVSAAVDHALKQKPALKAARPPIIIGRVMPTAVEHAAARDVEAASKEVTAAVNHQVAGLNVKPYPGPEILGFILREE